MKDFVRRTIQREHGNLEILPLSGDATPSDTWPISSALGRKLKTSDRGKSLITDTERRAEGNLAWARLRLDDICKAETLEDTLLRTDRLPRNLVALFDAGIWQIVRQREEVANLGLKAILLASLGLKAFPPITEEDQENSPDELGLEDDANEGVPFNDVRTWIYTYGRKVNYKLVTLKEVLHAARGFLKVETEVNPGDHIRLAVYHRDFGLYVRERYNATLIEVLEAMQSSSPSYSNE
jgi:hypothetical protein